MVLEYFHLVFRNAEVLELLLYLFLGSKGQLREAFVFAVLLLKQKLLLVFLDRDVGLDNELLKDFKSFVPVSASDNE